MGVPRTFVGFSSTDIRYYRLMLAWKENEKIDFNFANLQLDKEINSEDESYIKRCCRDRLNQAGYFIQLIGDDTRYKYKYVRWEAEIAVEKDCTIIGVNLNGSKKFDEERTPRVICDIGAVFVPFKPKIIKHALENYKMKERGNFVYQDSFYKSLGLE